jgi:hypothetical protein
MDVDGILTLTPSWRHPQALRHDRRPTLRRKLAGTIRKGSARVGSASDDRREPRNYLKPNVPYWNTPSPSVYWIRGPLPAPLFPHQDRDSLNYY